MAKVPFDDSENSKTVSEFILPNREWDTEALNRTLPKDICSWIVRSISVKGAYVNDKTLCNHPREVDFSIKLAYRLIAEEDLATPSNI